MGVRERTPIYFSLRNHYNRKHSNLLQDEQHGDLAGGDGQERPWRRPWRKPWRRRWCRRTSGSTSSVWFRTRGTKKNKKLMFLFIADQRWRQTMVDSVVSNATQIFENSVDLLQSGLAHCLHNAGRYDDSSTGVVHPCTWNIPWTSNIHYIYNYDIFIHIYYSAVFCQSHSIMGWSFI